MISDDIDRVKAEVDFVIGRHVGFAQSPQELVSRVAKDLSDKLDPGFAVCESVRVVDEDPDDGSVREVMEDPQGEFIIELSVRMVDSSRRVTFRVVVR
jgi:hypothetical protein